MRNLKFGVITENAPNRVLSIYHVIFKSAYEAFRKNFFIWWCFLFWEFRDEGNLLTNLQFCPEARPSVMKEH